MSGLPVCRDYIRRFLKITDKSGKLVPFLLNEPQERLYRVIREQWQQGKPVRIIILKSRQMGFSTLITAIIFWMAATAHRVQAMLVAHTDDATKNIFKKILLFYENLPEPLKPMKRSSNAQELTFDRPARFRGDARGLGSNIRCATAGGEGIGRSFTIRALHLSELAFWPGDKMNTLTGLLQAVPDEAGTLVVIESTANGFDAFKNLWDKADANFAAGVEGFTPVFFPWFEMSSYRRHIPKGFERTEEEEKLAETFQLDDYQLAWRRWCIEVNCGGSVDRFHQEYPSTPDEAFISTGRCVFDKRALVLRREQVRKDRWEYGAFRVRLDTAGKIASWEWVPEAGGPIRIRKKPEEGVPYVLSGDTAGTGSDFFAGHILDNRTGEQVAVIHHQLGERFFSEQMCCLGFFYNEALIGVETNYSTFPQMCMEELGYRNFYVRERLDNFTGSMVQAFGFETNSRTRPVIIDGLKDVVLRSLEMITDYETLGEMLTFILNDRWRPEAEQGEHDDLVMSLAIAHFIRGQQRVTAEKKPGERRKWTEDMWQDYQNATKDMREQMRKEWGDP